MDPVNASAREGTRAIRHDSTKHSEIIVAMKPSRVVAWRSEIFSTNNDLSLPARAVAACLSTHMDRNGRSCFPSVATIAGETNACERSVYNALDELERGGFLIRHKGGGRGKSNRYEASSPDVKGASPAVFQEPERVHQGSETLHQMQRNPAPDVPLGRPLGRPELQDVHGVVASEDDSAAKEQGQDRAFDRVLKKGERVDAKPSLSLVGFDGSTNSPATQTPVQVNTCCYVRGGTYPDGSYGDPNDGCTKTATEQNPYGVWFCDEHLTQWRRAANWAPPTNDGAATPLECRPNEAGLAGDTRNRGIDGGRKNVDAGCVCSA